MEPSNKLKNYTGTPENTLLIFLYIEAQAKPRVPSLKQLFKIGKRKVSSNTLTLKEVSVLPSPLPKYSL